MDDFKNILDDIFETENIDKNYFKKFEINEKLIIHFIFHENQKIIKGNITSASIEAVGFIVKAADEYYYCPLNNKKLDENIIKEFADTLTCL